MLLEVMGRGGREHNLELPGLPRPWLCGAQHSQTSSTQQLALSQPFAAQLSPSSFSSFSLAASSPTSRLANAPSLSDGTGCFPSCAGQGTGVIGGTWLRAGHTQCQHPPLCSRQCCPVFNTEAGDGGRAGERLQTMGWPGVG